MPMEVKKFKNIIDIKKKLFQDPPFFVLLDTNFVYFALKNKIDLYSGFLNCFSGKTVVCVTNCVILELEKLGHKFRLALKCVQDDRIQKINCIHPSKIIYADDCLCETVKLFQNFFIASCDKGLKLRIKKFSSVPIISIKKKKFFICL